MNNNQTKESKPAKLASFIDYTGIYFGYKDSLENFYNTFKKVTKDLNHYYKFNANTFSYEVIAYLNNIEILYVVSIYENREGEGYTIQTRRLNNCSGKYCFEEMEKLWIKLNESGLVFCNKFIKFKENCGSRNKIIPNFLELSLNDSKFYEDALKSIEKQLESDYPVNQFGLYHIIDIIKNYELTEYLKKSNLIRKVVDKFVNLINPYLHRLFLVLIRELIDSCHEEIMKNNLILDYIYTRLNKNNFNDLYLYEEERQSLLILKKLYNCENGVYRKVLKEKNYTPILSKLIEVTDQEIVKEIAEEVNKLLITPTDI
jgi:hypothetical protein